MEISGFDRPYFRIKKSTFNANECPTLMEIRQRLLDRDTSFEIVINNESPLSVTTNPGDTALTYLRSAYAIHQPFVSNDYDYLKQNMKEIGCKIRSMPYYLIVTYEIQYWTTSEQERLISEKVNDIISTGRVNEKKNDFLKTKFIYDYILTNVEYDYTYANHSVYHALFDKSAVCDGCAALLYRLLCSVNVPCRIITGRGLKERHAWNIAKIGGSWYNLDVTWDLYCRWENRTLIAYKWFLKGEHNFLEHACDAEYMDDEFKTRFNISSVDFYNAHVNG